MLERAVRVAEMLGGRAVLGRDVRNDADLAAAVDAGVPAAALTRLAELLGPSVSRDDLVEFVGGGAEASRSQAADPRLSTVSSASVVRVARLLSHAEETLGSAAKGRRWLVQRNRALDGRRPIEWARADADVARVVDVLGRIAHGVVG